MKHRYIKYRYGPHGSKEWDAYYKVVNIKSEQKRCLENVEFLQMVDDALRLTEKRHGTDIRILELGCGSAPLAAYLSQKGYKVEVSDYSGTLVKRLKDEFDFEAFTADCRNMNNVDDNSYDLVMLAGTVYEHTNFSEPITIYKEIHRILKKGGIFLNLLNIYKSRLTMGTMIKHNIGVHTNLYWLARFLIKGVGYNLINLLIYKPFKKEGLDVYAKQTHLWLYNERDLRAFGANAGLKFEISRYMQIEYAICRLLPAACTNKNTFSYDAPNLHRTEMLWPWAHRRQRRIISYESAYLHRTEMLRPWAQKLAIYMRKNPRLWGRSMGILFSKI